MVDGNFCLSYHGVERMRRTQQEEQIRLRVYVNVMVYVKVKLKQINTLRDTASSNHRHYRL